MAVSVLLLAHVVLAASSLVLENPTVDEVAHLPAGVTYWEKRTFRLYPHNPPLIKLAAALPVVLRATQPPELYHVPSWTEEPPSQATFAHSFARAHAEEDYFEIFRSARLVMPLFSAIGGLAVFAWSRRLYGNGGGVLSLVLWCLCPNVLAHARLVTSDLGATALGFAATYLFWRYLRAPGWRWAVAAGVALGLAQLAKFSMLLLYAIWPLLWLTRLLLTTRAAEWPARAARGVAHGALIVALSILTIDAGYLFEGVGRPLGHFPFASRALTRPRMVGGGPMPNGKNWLLNLAWFHRVNRFKGTWLEHLPAPLPRYYLSGFDEQKLESEGIPDAWLPQPAPARAGNAGGGAVRGYTVYLDGEMRQTGWWYYYLLTLAYKVPEGTWCLVLLSLGVLVARTRTREAWADELTLWAVPATVLITMSALTDINLGLRYVLPIAPYVFVAAGKVVPWAADLRGRIARRVAWTVVGLALAMNVASVLLIHPHYLAYFNVASGGPDRVPPHLIDSNLDWGQDLVGLREWLRANAPRERVGLAYFGQFNPSLFALRGDGFEWFLPPVRAGTTRVMDQLDPKDLVGPAPRLVPGLYAVSASLVYGLPWRLYEPAQRTRAWGPSWNASEPDAFGYFRALTPIARVGHSIYVYRVTADDAARLAPMIAGTEPLPDPNRRRP